MADTATESTSKSTYRTAALKSAMKVLKRAKGPLTRAEINERVGELDEANDKSHKVAGEVNDAEFAGRIVDGYFFTRPARGQYSVEKAPDGLENAAELAAAIRAKSKEVDEDEASQDGHAESDGNKS